MSSVSVIIVNWNGRHLLPECLDSLRAQTRPADEIVVIDNGSNDGSQALIRERYPEVTLVELDDNKGFSAANNIAIHRAKGDYIALLNNDLLVAPQWIATMVAAIETDASLGSCACKMLSYNRRNIIDAAGMNYSKSGEASNRGFGEQDGEEFSRPKTVFGACAGAALYRATMLQDIGLFDEDLYIYYEDVDLAFRAQLTGYNCLYVPEAVVYHHHSASNSNPANKYYYLVRNNVLVIAKTVPTPLLGRYLILIIARLVKTGLVITRAGYLQAYVRGCLDAVRLLPLMMRKRRTIQQHARRSAKQIAARLT